MQPKWGAVVLAALTVAACGGGGGSSSGVPAGVSTTGTTTSPQASLGASVGLSYADFGYWNTPTGPANYYASGPLTPAAQLPPTGANITATYNGVYAETHTAYGNAGIPEPAGSDTGALQINANFGATSVSISFTTGFLLRLFGENVTPPGSINSAGSYSIYDSTFSNLFRGVLRINGAFYGSSTPSQAPPETAGTFSGTIGTAGNLNGTITSAGTITGSFGAHR